VNPALFLPGDNQLNLRLIAHYARDCEDPFHSSCGPMSATSSPAST
jgi:cellulose synthase (UDP-forming)